MKNSIIEANYNKDTGISIVTIGTKYGKFTGKCKLAANDKPSSYAGCRFAEYKAWIKCYKYQLHNINIQLKSFKTFYDQCISSKKFNREHWESKRIIQYYNYLISQKQKIEETIIEYQKILHDEIEERTRLLDCYYNKNQDLCVKST